MQLAKDTRISGDRSTHVTGDPGMLNQRVPGEATGLPGSALRTAKPECRPGLQALRPVV